MVKSTFKHKYVQPAYYVIVDEHYLPMCFLLPIVLTQKFNFISKSKREKKWEASYWYLFTVLFGKSNNITQIVL